MDFTKISLALGRGENNFTMKRGSFNYKRKLHYKEVLEKKDVTKNGDEILIEFVGKCIEEGVFVRVSNDGELTEICLEGNIPADINRFFLTFPSDENERFYGCGETYSKFNLKGEKVRIWVAEHQNAKRISKKIITETLFGKKPNKKHKFSEYESYYAQPTFVSDKKYFVHADVNAYSEFDFRNSNEFTLEFCERPHIYVGIADDFEKLSFKMGELLGGRRSLPEWTAEGVILASQDWKILDGKTVSAENGIEIIEEKIAKCLEAGIPIKGFWCQDWCGCRCTGFGYQVMWNWQYDEVKYPDLPEKISRWKKQGIHFLGYINPFIALEKNLYKIASEKGYCVKNGAGEDYLVTITTFPAAMIDFTNPEAYDWYKNIIKTNMIGIGLGGWMADFGEYLPTDAVLYSGEDPDELHNRWPAIWAKMNREAIDECGVGEEVFFFTRAGHTDTVKYSDMMWTGDQHVDWSRDDGLPSVIPATLSLAMSGYGYTHSDVGGYTTIMNMTRSRELLLRWEEMNAFSPLFRGHEGNQPGRNPQVLDDNELTEGLKRAAGWHVALKLYLQQLTKQMCNEHIPMMRPVFYHYDEEWAYDEMTEYMLGHDILVAPVISKGAVSRTLRLPEDTWIHLFTGTEYYGGEVTVDAPVGKPPVFIRKTEMGIPENLVILYGNCVEK